MPNEARETLDSTVLCHVYQAPTLSDRGEIRKLTKGPKGEELEDEIIWGNEEPFEVRRIERV